MGICLGKMMHVCNSLSLSQLLAVWKPEKEFGCLACGEQVDFGKAIEVNRGAPETQPSVPGAADHRLQD